MNELETEGLHRTLHTWIENNQREFIEDIKTLVRIPSVADAPNGRYPFGEPCGQVTDKAEELIRKIGLEVKPYDYYGISGVYPGERPESIGFFSHLDVVPVGDGWTTSPFEPVEKDGYIIGRGTGDNKGAAVAVLYTFKFLREQHIRLKHRFFVFLGCNEERGMEDVKHFLKVDTPPVFALVSDSFFPVCNGEKGILTANFTTQLPGGNLVSFTGGSASNIVPDYAAVVLRGLRAEETRPVLNQGFTVEDIGSDRIQISVRGISGHAAFPEGSVNALQKLTAELIRTGLAGREAIRALSFAADCFSDHYGQGLNIPYVDELSGKTTHVGSTAVTSKGKLIFGINIRYAITSPQDELIERLKQKGADYGYTLENIDNHPPCHTPVDDPAVIALTNIVNRNLKTNLTPYVMGGGTHARLLPRALGFGPGRKDLPPPFGHQQGRSHQVNEAVSIQQLLDAIHIYTEAILTLDHLIQL